MSKISAIIITKNEEGNIRECLQSVLWADEIVVVDSGSTDRTAEICRAMGAKVFVHDWPGFGPQKNRALGYASNEWVFSIDADERVTPELHQELIDAMKDGSINGYYCPRLSQFCGTFVRHSGWYPDYVLRLFRRGQGRFNDNLVHESIILHGATARLKSHLLHYSYLSRQDVERKVAQYSDYAAAQMHKAGKRSSLFAAGGRAAWAMIRTFIFRLGFLDGLTGWRIAVMNARTTYLKYRKLVALRKAAG